MSRDGIDLIVPWVNDSDPNWLKEFEAYSLKFDGDKRRIRFRNWGSFHFLFRGIERYAPWVRRVHLVTSSHLPEWLNLGHPKVRVVYHRDFLCPQNLPTFNINAIEVNIHRIQHLASRFLYFNDDTFLLSYVKISRFFKKGLPRDIFALSAVSPKDPIAHIKVNNLKIINQFFNKKQVMLNNVSKWFQVKYRLEFLKTLLLLPWPTFTGFYDPHQPQPFLKSTFMEVWDEMEEILERTSASRFRSITDVNQYLFRYWQLVQGRFYPVSVKDSYSTSIRTVKDAHRIAHVIRNRRYRMLCVNDALESDDEEEFLRAKEIINTAFQEILPEKSEFEL